MFKNVIPYRITALAIDALGANEALDMRFLAMTGAVQESFDMVEALEVS